jgi:hypothetical protein
MKLKKGITTMQKTITVKGKRYTGKQVAALFSENEMTNGEDYIVTLNGEKFFANYRQVQDAYFAPTCNESDANAIALMPNNSVFGYSYSWDIWLEYP